MRASKNKLIQTALAGNRGTPY